MRSALEIMGGTKCLVFPGTGFDGHDDQLQQQDQQQFIRDLANHVSEFFLRIRDAHLRARYEVAN
jgi:hypothetical protein